MASELFLVCTDLVGSTATLERIGDERAADLWADHDRAARDLLVRHHGREIDRTDGFLLSFAAGVDAARFALDYQDAVTRLNLQARVALHHGAVTLRSNTPEDVARGAKPMEVEGLAKPYVARLMSLALEGQTLLSAPARLALAEAGGLPEGASVDRHGHYRLKGVEVPAEVFELGLPGRAPFRPPEDTDKAYRVVADGPLWRPVREVRHNVPAEHDAFVGRVDEIRALAHRFDSGARLVTVLGVGGAGKTRFACRYALSWLGRWPGGVVFCDLSEARSQDGILFALSLAMGVALGKDDPAVQLGHAIAARGHCLIVLDNFEQVAAHASRTLGDWAKRATDACFLSTSRERLHLPGETIFSLEPLPLDKDAVELFAVRAAARRPDFLLDAANHRAISEVVRLLDGLPLAIELAAARVGVFSPAQLVERLRDKFAVLAGARAGSGRQATLKAAIDWSWALLAPWEQATLAQCAVFEGGFSLGAAEVVIDLAEFPDAPPVVDAIQSLLDKSLLRSWVLRDQQRRLGIDEPTFGMYLTIHEYARARLLETAWPAVRDAPVRHARHFASFGTADAVESLFGPSGAQRRRALAADLDNLVAACRRSAERGDGAIAVANQRAAWEVLDLQGPFGLGLELAAHVLAADGLTKAQRMSAHLAHGIAAWRLGRSNEAGADFARALRLRHGGSDPADIARILRHVGSLLRERGFPARAEVRYRRALALARQAGRRRLEGELLASLATIRAEQGDGGAARPLYAQALAIAHASGNLRDEGTILGNIGTVDLERGRPEEARAHYARALSLCIDVGNLRGEASIRGNLGNLAFQQGRMEEAEDCYVRALGCSRDSGSRRSEGLILANLGGMHLLKGELEAAQDCFDTSLVIAREVSSRRDEAFVLAQLGSLSSRLGRQDEAVRHLEQSIDIARRIGKGIGTGGTLSALAEVLLAQGLNAKARLCASEASSILVAIGDELGTAKVQCIRGQIELADGHAEMARDALLAAKASAASLRAEPHSDLGLAIARLESLLKRLPRSHATS